MKKFIYFILCLTLALSLVACNSGSSAPETPPSTGNPTITVPNININTEPKYDYYIVNVVTEKFHRPTCKYLPSRENSKRRYDSADYLVYVGYSPCKHCKPY